MVWWITAPWQKYKLWTIMRWQRMKSLLNASHHRGHTKSLRTFYKVLENLPCLSALICHSIPVHSLLSLWTLLHTACNILPSPTSGPDFPDHLIQIRILSLIFHSPSLCYFSLQHLSPCTNYVFYLFILWLICLPSSQEQNLPKGRSVGLFYLLPYP